MHSLTRLFCLFYSCTSLFGCTHIQLRNTSVSQALTITDIQYQQVLDNLAKFVNNPHEMPGLAFPTAASNAVNDTASAGATPTFTARAFTPWVVPLGGSRLLQQNWTLSPVTSPDRLNRIRCAYQVVVESHSPQQDEKPLAHENSSSREVPGEQSNIEVGRGPSECSKCKDEFVAMGLLPSLKDKLEKAFADSPYEGAIEWPRFLGPKLPLNPTYFQRMESASLESSEETDPPEAKKGTGGGLIWITQVEDLEKVQKVIDAAYAQYEQEFAQQTCCNFPQHWFGVASKRRDVPKNACYVGYDCGTYVWVCSEGVDSLARFTMTVMKLGTSDPLLPPAPAQVLYSYGETGDLNSAFVLMPGIRRDLPKKYEDLQSFPRSVHLNDTGVLQPGNETNNAISGLRSFIQLNNR